MSPRCARLLIAALLLATVPAAIRADWPQILGPDRSGVYDGPTLAQTWPADGPTELWQVDVGSGFAGPAVADGKVILFHRRGGDERVEALAVETGKVLWSFGYSTGYRDAFGFDNGPRAVPTIADGKVFAFGAEGTLHALDLDTGKMLWRRDTHRDFGAGNGYFGAACSPLVVDGRVIVNVGGSDGAGIVAFDAADGATVWTATDHEASYSSPVIATLDGRRAVLVFTREGLVELDPATGRQRSFFRWRARINASVNAALPRVLGDDRVFLSASYGTGAVLLDLAGPADLADLAEGEPKPIWESKAALTNHYATSVAHDGHLYGFHGRQESGPALRAIRIADGQVAWSEERFGAGSLLVAAEKLVILTERGELIVAPATPEGFRPELRTRILDPTVRAYPALSDGVLYARDGRHLVAVELRPAAD